MALSALLVYSDADAARVLGQLLADRGIEVERCDAAGLAAARVAGQGLAVVLVDCKDEPAAIELITAARSAPSNATMLIVAIVDARNDTRELFARGANFLLYKPVSAERAAESLQAAWSLLPRDRRRKKRVHVSSQASITYATTEDAPVPLLNLSGDGVALHSQGKMPPPCRVYFQFTLPGDPAIVRLSGEVVWQDSRGQVGVHFAHVPQASRRMLDAWLRKGLPRHEEQNETATLVLESPDIELDDDPAPAESSPEPVSSSEFISSSEFVSSSESVSSSEAVSSPESVSSAESELESERRAQARRTCRLGVNIYGPGGGALQHCILTDISGGGCYVETTHPLTEGSNAIIELRTQELQLYVRGKVQSKHPGYGMGVEFKLRTEEEREQVKKLTAYVDAQLEARSETALEQS
jgi:CheY-like chemotaxis protein